MQNLKFKMQNEEYRMQNLKLNTQNLKFKNKKFKVQNNKYFFKKIIVFTILIVLIFCNLFETYGEPNILCNSVILIDAETGNVLFEKNSQAKMYPASLTKILTAIIALEKGNLDDIITVDEDTPYEIDGSHIALEPGEKLTLKDLLHALLIESANDAASVIAKHYGGSIENFAEIMNKKAKEIGANNTHFVNPHGLHDKNHYTTAEDLSKISIYAMQNETFREIVKTKSYKINPTNMKEEPRNIYTKNKLLFATGYGNQIKVNGKYVDAKYEGTKGIKTGYTPEAGSCLISYVERNNLKLITVVLKGAQWDVYADTHNLLNYGFNNFEEVSLIDKNEFIQNIEVLDGTSRYISAISQDEFKTIVNKNNSNNIEKKINIFNLTLPIEKDTVIGNIEYVLNNKVIGSVNLISPIAVDKSSNMKLMEKIYSIPIWIKILICAVVLIIIIRIYNKIKRKLNRKKRKKEREKRKKEGFY